MSVVLAGSVALIKEINNEFSPADYKKVMIDTSREIKYKGDTFAAVKLIKQFSIEE